MFCCLHIWFLKLHRSENGSIFVLLAAAIFALVIATGSAVDMTRAQILQSRISTALDAAGLAAGSTASNYPSCSSPTTNAQCQQNWVQSQASRYFNANFQSGYLGSAAVTVTATLSSDLSTISLSATTTQATAFMKVVGINTVNVGATSTITRATSGMELALVLDNTGSMADPVDSQDSSAPKILALKCALGGEAAAGGNGSQCSSNNLVTTGLLDILFGNNASIPNLWVGVVPFTDMVNIGTGYSSWMDTTYDSTLDFGPTLSGSTCTAYSGATVSYSSSKGTCSYKLSGTAVPNFGLTNWAGCVSARSATTASPTYPSMDLDSSDDPPSSSVTGSYFQAFYDPTNATGVNNGSCSGSSGAGGGGDWSCSSTSGYGSNKTTTTLYEMSSITTTNNTAGPNIYCPVQVLPMTAYKSNVISTVTTMQPNGDTMINMGMAWGWRMLSPNWTGQWGGEMNAASPQLPLPYNTPLMNKVIILMTDGENNTDQYGAYIGQTTPSDSSLDSRTLAICNALKGNNAIVYTIGFGPSSGVNTTLLSSCAGGPGASGTTGQFFLAPTNAALESAFQQIGDALANLRVSH